MDELELSPEAEYQWEHIADYDRPLADVIERVLDDIESGAITGSMYANHARFVPVRIPGRDDQYAVIWQNRPEGPYALYIGRVSR